MPFSTASGVCKHFLPFARPRTLFISFQVSICAAINIMAGVGREKEATAAGTATSSPVPGQGSELVNASGHVQEVDRK